MEWRKTTTSSIFFIFLFSVYTFVALVKFFMRVFFGCFWMYTININRNGLNLETFWFILLVCCCMKHLCVRVYFKSWKKWQKMRELTHASRTSFLSKQNGSSLKWKAGRMKRNFVSSKQTHFTFYFISKRMSVDLQEKLELYGFRYCGTVLLYWLVGYILALTMTLWSLKYTSHFLDDAILNNNEKNETKATTAKKSDSHAYIHDWQARCKKSTHHNNYERFE